VENYLGIVQKRKEEKPTSLGFDSWWLTLDQAAFRLTDEIQNRLSMRPPPSPVLSPDFLSNYLAVGPIRRMLAKSTEARLPIMLDISSVEGIPLALLHVAESVRDKNRDLPQRIIGRRIRDALNAAKSRMGLLATGGAAAVEQGILAATAKDRGEA
jgi:hypothetical protein